VHIVPNGSGIAVRRMAMVVIVVWGAIFIEGSAAMEQERSFQFEGVRSITVSAVVGNILIRQGDQPLCLVDFKNELKQPAMQPPMVEFEAGELRITEIVGDGRQEGSTHWVITLPDTVNVDRIDCTTINGEIAVKGNGLSMRAEVPDTTLTGRLRTRELRLVTRSSGRVSVKGVQAESMEITTAMASIMLDACIIDRRAVLATVEGNVKVSLPYLPRERFEASSTTGTVELSVPEFGAHFTLLIRNYQGKGTVQSPFPCTEKPEPQYDKSDIYRTEQCLVKRGEGGPDVRLSTGTGKVKLRTKNDTDGR